MKSVNAVVCGKELSQLVQGFVQLTAGPAAIVAAEVVQTCRCLYQALHEEPFRTPHPPPQLLPDLVRLEEAAGIELINPPPEQLILFRKHNQKEKE